MTTLYLIRHGEVAYQTDAEGRKLIYGPDIHLSSVGREQLTALGTKLRNEQVSFDHIYTSPFVRAQQSAGILADILTSPVTIVPELHDSWMPGWVGLTMDYLMSVSGNHHSIPPLSDDQETLDMIAKRITTSINALVAKSAGKTIAVVSHGDPLAIYIHSLLNPNSPPDINRDADYPTKGQARRVVFDDAGTLVSCDHYRVEGQEAIIF